MSQYLEKYILIKGQPIHSFGFVNVSQKPKAKLAKKLSKSDQIVASGLKIITYFLLEERVLCSPLLQIKKDLVLQQRAGLGSTPQHAKVQKVTYFNVPKFHLGILPFIIFD